MISQIFDFLPKVTLNDILKSSAGKVLLKIEVKNLYIDAVLNVGDYCDLPQP